MDRQKIFWETQPNCAPYSYELHAKGWHGHNFRGKRAESCYLGKPCFGPPILSETDVTIGLEYIAGEAYVYRIIR